jgi:DNA-binding NarL/FixJ family response regulator
LTRRERQVLLLMGDGATNREIARDLHISPGRAKNIVSDVLTKLCLRSRTEAAALAARAGLLDDREIGRSGS